MSVRLRIPEVDYRNSLDDGSFIITDANAKIRYYLAGTTTLTEVWADKDLTTSLGSSVSILASGWPEYVNVWGRDDVSYKATIQRTGYNSGNEKDFDWINVATATSATGDSTPAFTNSIANGDFTQWSGPTSFSNISGSAAAVEIADGFYFSQNNAAANAISRQSADSDGARYGLRFGRPAASSSTEQLRVFFTLPTEEAIRYRGKTGTFSIAIKKGANFSGTALGILGVTGTGVEEDGNSINSGAWTGQASFISASQAINTDIARFQFSGAIGENISEIGFQLAYTPTGTAGANDWVQVEDIQFQDAAAAGDFEALPKRVTKLLTRGYAERGASIASDGTVDLYKATGDFVDITGTTTISSFGEAEAGFEIEVRFTGILKLTYNASTMRLPGNADIITQANDTATFRSYGGGNWECVKYQRRAIAPRRKAYLGRFIKGLELSNNTSDATNDIDIALGYCADSTDLFLIELAAGITKRLDADWVPGTNQGCRYSGAAIANTTYHYWAVSKVDGTSDVYATPNASASTAAAARALLQAEPNGSEYVYAQYIGSVIRSGAAIVAFSQYKDTFKIGTGVADRASTSAVALGALTITVPLGIVVEPIFSQAQIQSGAGDCYTSIGSGGLPTDATPVITRSRAANEPSYALIAGGFKTNTSAQIRIEVIVSSGTLSANITTTLGWIVNRMGVY